MITKDHVVNGARPRLEHYWRPCPVSELHHTHGIGVEHSRARTHAPSTSLAYTRRIDQAHEISTWFDQPDGQRSLRKTRDGARRYCTLRYQGAPHCKTKSTVVGHGVPGQRRAGRSRCRAKQQSPAEPSRAQRLFLRELPSNAPLPKSLLYARSCYRDLRVPYLPRGS